MWLQLLLKYLVILLDILSEEFSLRYNEIINRSILCRKLKAHQIELKYSFVVALILQLDFHQKCNFVLQKQQ